MSAFWYLKQVLSSLLLPPGALLLLLLLAGLGRRRFPRFALALAGLAFALLTALSLPVVSVQLNRLLQPPPLQPEQIAGCQAIVVLGGGLIAGPEFGELTVPGDVMLRLRYGAYLQRQTGLPILVTGGLGPDRGPVRSEADAMARTLERDFQVPVRWREGQSEDTEQNARYSAEILQAAGIRRVLLVSQAWHLPRAMRLFAQAG
ncbi:MAG: hypothetical protein RIR00_1514, partial [Pseudomonadota bacterium]